MSAEVSVTRRNRSDRCPTSPASTEPAPPGRTVSTRIGSLNNGPVSTCPSQITASALNRYQPPTRCRQTRHNIITHRPVYQPTCRQPAPHPVIHPSRNAAAKLATRSPRTPVGAPPDSVTPKQRDKHRAAPQSSLTRPCRITMARSVQTGSALVGAMANYPSPPLLTPRSHAITRPDLQPLTDR